MPVVANSITYRRPRKCLLLTGTTRSEHSMVRFRGNDSAASFAGSCFSSEQFIDSSIRFQASRRGLQSSDESTPFVSCKALFARRYVVAGGVHLHHSLCKRWNNVDFQTFDGAYVERLRAGDKDTEGHFIAYFGELIVLKLRSRLTSRQALDDVKQETFARCLQLLRSEGGVRNAERLGPLVNSICNHVLSEHFRATTRTEALEDQPAERFVAHEPDALTRVIAEDTCRMVRLVLEKLPERDRTILRAVFLEERRKMTYAGKSASHGTTFGYYCIAQSNHSAKLT